MGPRYTLRPARPRHPGVLIQRHLPQLTERPQHRMQGAKSGSYAVTPIGKGRLRTHRTGRYARSRSHRSLGWQLIPIRQGRAYQAPTLRPGLRPEGVAPPGQHNIAICHRRPPFTRAVGISAGHALWSQLGRGSASATVDPLAVSVFTATPGLGTLYSPQRTRLCARYLTLPLVCTAPTPSTPPTTTFCRSEKSKLLALSPPCVTAAHPALPDHQPFDGHRHADGDWAGGSSRFWACLGLWQAALCQTANSWRRVQGTLEHWASPRQIATYLLCGRCSQPRIRPARQRSTSEHT